MVLEKAPVRSLDSEDDTQASVGAYKTTHVTTGKAKSQNSSNAMPSNSSEKAVMYKKDAENYGFYKEPQELDKLL